MKFIKSVFVPLLINIFVISFFSGCLKKEDMTEEFKRFVKDYETKVVPLYTDANTAYFNATISGKEEDYKKAADLQVQLSKIYASKADFAKLKRFKDSNTIQDELLNRQLIKIYNAYASSQIDEKKLEEMIRLQNETEKKFSTFRANVNGKKITDNEVEN
ncbi:MAG: M2 family metallopeptidase, partial [Ignavibacteria bacterium]|nr:M2 family metallopeptidase [Ignavibacteria bacterium]